MYNYIQGTVKGVDPSGITLDNAGIGYHIVPPNPYAYTPGDTVLVHTYHYVREDLAILYGFHSLEQKALFERLISVKGIGPKSALAVLASAEVDDIIRAIETGDAKYLNRFPGIGPKASQQIVLDLKGKVTQSGVTLKSSQRIEEVEDALKSLGYKAKEIAVLTDSLDPTLDTATLVRQALKKKAQ